MLLRVGKLTPTLASLLPLLCCCSLYFADSASLCHCLFSGVLFSPVTSISCSTIPDSLYSAAVSTLLPPLLSFLLLLCCSLSATASISCSTTSTSLYRATISTSLSALSPTSASTPSLPLLSQLPLLLSPVPLTLLCDILFFFWYCHFLLFCHFLYFIESASLSGAIDFCRSLSLLLSPVPLPPFLAMLLSCPLFCLHFSLCHSLLLCRHLLYSATTTSLSADTSSLSTAAASLSLLLLPLLFPCHFSLHY